jgi:hypothetical protein
MRLIISLALLPAATCQAAFAQTPRAKNAVYADRMKVIRGGDEAKIPELFGAAASDPVKNIEVADIRAGSGPVLGNGRTEQMLDSRGYDLRNLANTRRLQSYVELFNINGDIQFWIKFRALWRSCSFCAWVNDRTDIGGYGNYRFSGQAQTQWIRPYIYRHTHDELLCQGCIPALNCVAGNCLISSTSTVQHSAEGLAGQFSFSY